MDETFYINEIKRGNFQVLTKPDYSWVDNAMNYAVLADSVECMRYALDNGCPYNAGVSYDASLSGSLQCLAMALTLDESFSYDAFNQQLNILLRAIQEGHRHILEYIKTLNWDINGSYRPVWNDQCFEILLQKGSLDFITFCFSTFELYSRSSQYFDSYAAKEGRLDVIKWLVKKRLATIDWYTICCAAQNGHLEVVKYLLKQGNSRSIINTQVLTLAARNGHFEVFEYLYKRLTKGLSVSQKLETQEKFWESLKPGRGWRPGGWCDSYIIEKLNFDKPVFRSMLNMKFNEIYHHQISAKAKAKTIELNKLKAEITMQSPFAKDLTEHCILKYV